MRTKSNMKKLKFFLTFHKERQWLEKMALQGYMLELVVFVAAAGLLLNLFLEKISGGAAEARTDTVKIYNALCGICGSYFFYGMCAF